MTSKKIIQLAKAGSILGLFLVFVFAYQACQSLEADNPLLMTIDHMEFVSEGSYKITGTLASLGDREIIEHGICWSESEKPDMGCSLMELGPPSSTGEFSATLSGLSARFRGIQRGEPISAVLDFHIQWIQLCMVS